MTRKRKLVIAAVALAGLVLAAGIFWATAGVLTSRQQAASVERSTIPIEKKPNTPQPPSGELQAAARVDVEFLKAYFAGCLIATTDFTYGGKGWDPETVVDRIRPYVTDQAIQAARTRGWEYCWSWYGHPISRIEVLRIISYGWTDHGLRLVADSRIWIGESYLRNGFAVLLVRQPDGWKADYIAWA